MYLHPVTIMIGLLGVLAVTALTVIGLSCTYHIMNSVEFNLIIELINIGNRMKVC